MDTKLRGPSLSSKVLIHNIDIITDGEDIRRALKPLLGNYSETNIRIDNIRRHENSRTALISLSKRDAERLTQMGHEKIGWNFCRVKEWITLPICFKCQEVGHRTTDCQEQEEKPRRCYKCGQEGHIGKACENKDIQCEACG